MSELEELECSLAAGEAEYRDLMARNEAVMSELGGLLAQDRPGWNAPRIGELNAEYRRNNDRLRVLGQGLHSLRLQVTSARLDAHPEELDALRLEETQAYGAVVDAVAVLANVQRQISALGALPHKHVSLGLVNY